MTTPITQTDFAVSEPRQIVRLALADAPLERLPDAGRRLGRIARVRRVAANALAELAAVTVWMGAAQVMLFGRAPEAVPAAGEDRCQLMLRKLVRLGRLAEASLG